MILDTCDPRWEVEGKLEELGVHPQLGPVGRGWGIEQNPWEFGQFISAIWPIESVLEIGTGYRAGLSRFMHSVLGLEVVTVDIKSYSTQTRLSSVEYIVSDKRVDFKIRKFDLVLIDGDHSYDAVKADYEWYKKYASKIVAFHDIAGLRQCDGVAKFWQEVSRTMRKGYHEVIADGQRAAGIGWGEIK
jgi:hypothetical protein